MKNLTDYERIDQHIFHTAFNKFCNHLWYLSDEAVALAFFDSSVPLMTKQRMIEALKTNEGSSEAHKHLQIQVKDVVIYKEKEMESFVSTNTMHFLKDLIYPPNI